MDKQHEMHILMCYEVSNHNHAIQIVFGWDWDDEYLHQFHIHEKDYGLKIGCDSVSKYDRAGC